MINDSVRIVFGQSLEPKKPDQNLTNFYRHQKRTEQNEPLAASVCAGGKGYKFHLNENTGGYLIASIRLLIDRLKVRFLPRPPIKSKYFVVQIIRT